MDLFTSFLENLSHAGGFVENNGPLIGGISAIIFTLIEVVVMARRFGEPQGQHGGAFEYIRHFGLMVGIVLVTGFGLYSLETKWIRKPQEIVWQELISQKLHKCLAGLATLSDQKRQEIEKRLIGYYESPRLHCLADALQKSVIAEPSIGVNTPAAVLFRTHMRIADALLAVKDVPNILSSALSVDAERFLGYGYSLSERVARSLEASTHEYLIRNRCATVSKAIGSCTNEAALSHEVFTWILDPADIARNPKETIGNILERTPRIKTSTNLFDILFKDIEKVRLNTSPPVLIRFAKFSVSKYLGTLGRPNATYVFFSDLSEMWNKSIADAESASGRIAETMHDPDERVFIWVYFSSSDDDARMATWKNVNYLLEHEIRVDPEISTLAD